MSMLLTAQALKLKVGNPARKLVLVKLADNANDNGECFPSYQHIADHCEMSRQSVINHINTLTEMGLVTKKVRKTAEGNTSNLYILHLENGIRNVSSSSQNSELGVVKNFYHPSQNSELGVVKNFDSEPITINQSINHTTLTGCNTHAHAKAAKTKKSSGGDLALLAEFGVTGELAEDFVKHRKAMKAPITKTALNGFQREADKAKIPITQAVAIAIERGWRGFRSDWDWQGLAKNPTNSTASFGNVNANPPLRMNDPGCMAGQIVKIEGELWEL